MGTWWMPACGRPPASSGAPRGHLSDRRGAFERNPSRGRMRKTLRSWAFVVEPPWGIEPQTYALRGCSRALLAGSKPALASCSQIAAGGDRWLLMAVRGHLGDTGP